MGGGGLRRSDTMVTDNKREPWNVNRLLVLAGAACIPIALMLVSGGDAASVASPESAPLFVGVLAAIVLAFWQRAWLYLVAGILVAAFPLVITFVFGAYNAFLHPSSGLEGAGILFLVLGSALALTGGVAGFVQGRRAAQPPVTLRAPQALFALLATFLVFGMSITSGLAGSDVRALVVAPATNVVPDESVRVVLTGYTFAPREIRLEQDKLYALALENGDPASHTFTYHDAAGVERNTLIPPHSTVVIHMLFDAPQTIHFWCAPHSMGEGDMSEDSMVGTIVVA